MRLALPVVWIAAWPCPVHGQPVSGLELAYDDGHCDEREVAIAPRHDLRQVFELSDFDLAGERRVSGVAVLSGRSSSDRRPRVTLRDLGEGGAVLDLSARGARAERSDSGEVWHRFDLENVDFRSPSFAVELSAAESSIIICADSGPPLHHRSQVRAGQRGIWTSPERPANFMIRAWVERGSPRLLGDLIRKAPPAAFKNRESKDGLLALVEAAQSKIEAKDVEGASRILLTDLQERAGSGTQGDGIVDDDLRRGVTGLGVEIAAGLAGPPQQGAITPESCGGVSVASPGAYRLVAGTELDDPDLDGTSGPDLIVGRGGDDVIDGRGGADLICGGPGDDEIRGGSGQDAIYGGEDADRLYGEGGADELYGGNGIDELYGGSGPDRLFGGDMGDLMYGNAGGDYMLGGSGDDTMYGGDGGDEMDGDRDDDEIYGNSGADEIYGFGGRDKIWGGSGGDTINGGDGPDEIYGESGGDTIEGGLDDDVIRGGEGRNTISGQDGADEIHGGGDRDTIFGGLGQDTLWGYSGRDTLSGGADSDYLYGGPGRDILDGGGGYDYLHGGGGADSCMSGPGNDTEISC